MVSNFPVNRISRSTSADDVSQIYLRGGSQSGDVGTPDYLFGDNRLGLSNCGGLDDCIYGSERFTSIQISSKDHSPVVYPVET